MSDKTEFKVDRSAFSVARMDEQKEDEIRFWREKSPAERLAGLELTRRIFYGYDPESARVERVLEVSTHTSLQSLG